MVAVVFTFLTSLDRRREAEANQPVSNDVVVTENTPTPEPVTPAPQQAAAVPGQEQGQSTPVTAAPATPAPTPRPEAAVMETPAPAADEDGVLRTELEREGFRLHIGLAPDGAGGYTVVEWRQTKDWETDDTIDNLWSGSFGEGG